MVVDEAVPPNRARRLAGIIQDQGLDLAWYFMGRVEKGFTADLCRQLADTRSVWHLFRPGIGM